MYSFRSQFRYDSNTFNWDASFLPVIVEPQNHSRATFAAEAVEPSLRLPAFGRSKNVFLELVAAGPLQRITWNKRSAIIPLLKEAATRLSEQLGYRESANRVRKEQAAIRLPMKNKSRKRIRREEP